MSNTCDICGRPVQRPQELTYCEGVLMCPMCVNLAGTCMMCKQGRSYCAYEEDPSPLPKRIMQTVQQGNMRFQQLTPNPERIELLCTKCGCFNTDEKYCNRQVTQTCGKYDENLDGHR